MRKGQFSIAQAALCFWFDFLKHFGIFIKFAELPGMSDVDVFVGNNFIIDPEVYQLWVNGYTGNYAVHTCSMGDHRHLYTGI